MKNKRGLSGVITSLLLILLTLVAVGVIWVVIANILNEGTDQIATDKFTVGLEIESVKANGGGTIDVKIHRKVGKADFDKVKIIINSGDETNTFEEEVNIKELETKVVKINYGGLIKSISVAPVFSSGMGNVDEKILSDAEQKELGWIRYKNNPVFSKESSNPWESLGVTQPIIAKDLNGNPYKDESGYYMFYTGMTYDYNSTGSPKISKDQFGLARSTDLITWQRVGPTPLLGIGAVGSYDHGDVQVATVLYNGTHFLAWYSSNQYNTSEGEFASPKGDNVTISFATSVNGLNWNKYPGNPIFVQGSGDDSGDMYGPLVFKDGNTWKMWYTGHNSAGNLGVMYATASSPQGPWVRQGNNYVFGPSDEPAVFAMDVFKEDGKYYLYYVNWTRPDSSIDLKLATSPNGISWSREGIIFEAGQTGSWEEDIVMHTSQFYVGDKWYTFYAGVDDGHSWDIGFARSYVRTPEPF